MNIYIADAERREAGLSEVNCQAVSGQRLKRQASAEFG
jgi:hypothetical protein